MNQKSYVIVDIETTGMSREYHGITEIAAVRFDWDRIVEEYQTLINPEMNIPSFITWLTWITNSMVADSPVIKDVLPQFYDFLWDDIFVAHNATFDKGFIEAKWRQHYWYEWEHDVLCTRKLANRIVSHLPSKSLWALCTHFWVVNQQAHRAMADVQATTVILKEFVELCQLHHGAWCAETLMNLQKKSVGYGKSIFGE